MVAYGKLLKYKETLLSDLFVVNKKLLFDEILKFLELKTKNEQCIEYIFNFVGNLKSFRESCFCYLGIFNIDDIENIDLDIITPFELSFDNYQRVVFFLRSKEKDYYFIDYRQQSEFVHIYSNEDLEKEEMNEKKKTIQKSIDMIVHYMKNIDCILHNPKINNFDKRYFFLDLAKVKAKIEGEKDELKKNNSHGTFKKNKEFLFFCIYIQFTTEKKVTSDFLENYSKYLVYLHEIMLYGIISATFLDFDNFQTSKLTIQ